MMLFQLLTLKAEACATADKTSYARQVGKRQRKRQHKKVLICPYHWDALKIPIFPAAVDLVDERHINDPEFPSEIYFLPHIKNTHNTFA